MSTAETPNPTADEQSVVNDLDLAHLAGVVDGIGTISASITKNEDYSIGYQFRVSVTVARSGGENDPLLGKILAYCDEYGISYKRQKTDRTVKIKIRKPEDVERFLVPLMDHFVSSYQRAVVVLDTVIPAMEEGRHLERDGFLELVEIADQLRATTSGGTEVKYDLDYFHDEWDEIEA